jgi:hypothetical protein
MSAYIVQPETIQTIATAAAAALEAHGLPMAPTAWERMIDDLCTNNVASIAYRYPDTAGHEVEAFTNMHPRIWRARAARRLPECPAAAEIASACRCYQYQSCEHPEWQESTARALVEAIRAKAEATALEEAAMQAKNARAAAQAQRTTDEAAGRAWLAQHRPSWAKASIVAELHTDKSDIQSDYFASATTRVVVLAWSKHTRDLFSEMRKAAASFGPTAFSFRF